MGRERKWKRNYGKEKGIGHGNGNRNGKVKGRKRKMETEKRNGWERAREMEKGELDWKGRSKRTLEGKGK